MPRGENETVKQYNARRARESFKRKRNAGLQQVSNIWAPDDELLRAAIRRAADKVIEKWKQNNDK